jgi:hypothetical protein
MLVSAVSRAMKIRGQGGSVPEFGGNAENKAILPDFPLFTAFRELIIRILDGL